MLPRHHMPALPSWYGRVPDILATLSDPACPPILDRTTFEKLFRVSRRQAIRLMGFSGGYQIGRTYLIHRQSLIDFLEKVKETGVVEQVVLRKERILANLNQIPRQARARDTQIRTDPEALSRRPAELPEAIHLLAPGQLQIHFQNAADLLAQIVELASAAANDFPKFQNTFEEGL